MKWQTIEDAPKDGTWILAVNASTNQGRQHVVHYSGMSDKFPWVTGPDHMSFVAGLTHWMPLRKPPSNV